MVTNPPEDRSPIALAYMWVARITTISIEMVAPGIVGFWLDGQLGTKSFHTGDLDYWIKMKIQVIMKDL